MKSQRPADFCILSFVQSYICCDTHLCGSAVSAGVLIGFAQFFQLCNLESKREVGERAAPGARVAPRHHRSVDFSDCDLVRFYCETTARSAQKRPQKENLCSHNCLTYVWQEEAPGVVLHQEVFGAQVDCDLERLALLSVRAVLLNPARNPIIAIAHWACDLTLSRGAGPASPTGVHRAGREAVIRSSGGDAVSDKGWAVYRRAEWEQCTYRWAVINATLPTRLVCQDQEQTNSPLKFFAEQLKYWSGKGTWTNREVFISWNVYLCFRECGLLWLWHKHRPTLVVF